MKDKREQNYKEKQHDKHNPMKAKRNRQTQKQCEGHFHKKEAKQQLTHHRIKSRMTDRSLA